MIDIIKESGYVEFYCPIVFHTIDAALLNCLDSILLGTISKRVCTELFVDNSLYFFFNDRLGYPVCYGGDAQCPLFPIEPGNVHLSHRHGIIASACHPHKCRIQVFAWLPLDVGDFNTVYTCASAIAFYCLKGFPYLSRFNWLRPLFLTKNHPSKPFGLSCNTIRKLSHVETLAPLPLQEIHSYYAPSAPVGCSIGISALSVRIFSIFPFHLPTGSPVPLISPDKVLATFMPDTEPQLIRLHAVLCLARPPTPRFWYRRCYSRHFNGRSLALNSLPH